MECKICGKSHEETELYRGVFEERIETVCANCARIEDIPIVKRPNPDSFEGRKEHLSVRERMEKMAQPNKPIPKEHFIAHKNLTKLNFPTKRQDHADLVENYDWILKTARRRKKLSQTQVAEGLIIPLQVIVDLESGKISKEFNNYVEKLEAYLGVQIRKRVPEKFNLQRKPVNLEEEKIVLDKVQQNINSPQDKNIQEDPTVQNKEKMKRWTLKDLIGLKRKKDKLEEKSKSEEKPEDLELID